MAIIHKSKVYGPERAFDRNFRGLRREKGPLLTALKNKKEVIIHA